MSVTTHPGGFYSEVVGDELHAWGPALDGLAPEKVPTFRERLQAVADERFPFIGLVTVTETDTQNLPATAPTKERVVAGTTTSAPSPKPTAAGTRTEGASAAVGKPAVRA
jgi:hypothetical protein